MSGSSIPLIIHSIEEISMYPIKRRNRCLYSWKWSNTSKSPRVSGDDRRNSGSCVVGRSGSGGGGCGCGSSNGGSSGGGGPLFLSSMLSREHIHQLIHSGPQGINVALHGRLPCLVLIHC